MVFKLTVLVGLGTYMYSACAHREIENKKFIDAITSKTEITTERAEKKILELNKKYPNIIKAFIIQSGKIKLDNGRTRKILATREGGKWT